MLINSSAINAAAINASSASLGPAVGWVSQASGISNTLNTVATDGITLLVGGDSAKLRKSVDGGLTWSAVSHSISSLSPFQAIRYGNGRWVALISSDLNSVIRRVALSSDGATWISQVNDVLAGATIRDQSFTYGNGKFIIGLGDGTVAISTDGMNWAISSTGSGSAFYSVGFGNGLFIASRYDGTLQTSTDGITWTTRASSMFANRAAYGGGTWVAAGNTGAMRISTDGVTWTTVTSGFGSSMIYAVVYGDGKWVAVGESGKIFASTNNAVTWTAETSTFSTSTIYDVVYQNDRFVAVGATGKLSVELFNQYNGLPAAGQISVAGDIFEGGYTGQPQTLTISVAGQSVVSSHAYTFRDFVNLYETGGWVVWSSPLLFAQGRDEVTVASQLAYDRDDGSNTRDMCITLVGGTHTDATKHLDGFISVDNFGSPSFINGELVGIASAILEEPLHGVNSLGGAYGAVSTDIFAPYYMDFIEGVVAETVPTRTATNDLIAVSRITPSQETSIDFVYPDYIEGVGLSCYHDSMDDVYLSVDRGESWVKEKFYNGFTPSAYKYWWLSGSFTIDGKCYKAFNSLIKYSTDNGSTWTTVFTASAEIFSGYVNAPFGISRDAGRLLAQRSPYAGPWYAGAIKQHPITGTLVCVGVNGYAYYSTNNGLAWTEKLIYSGSYPSLTLGFIPESDTFIAWASDAIFTSTDGVNWLRQTSANGFFFDFDVLKAGNILVSNRYAYISSNGGVTWANVWGAIESLALGLGWSFAPNGISFFQGNDVYFCSFHYASLQGFILRSNNGGVSWTRIYSTDLYTAPLEIYADLYAYGNGCHVFLASPAGAGDLLISNDNGFSFTHSAALLSDYAYNGLFYSTSLDLWVAYGDNGRLYSAKDPLGEWRKHTVTSFDGSTTPRILSCCEVSGKLVFGTTSDIHTLTDLYYSGETYTPNYPVKEQPITASGLIGFFCSAGQASGTVLQDGLHILTVAHAVYGVTSGDYASFDFRFNVPAGVTIPQPTVTGITIHPNYSHTASTSGWFNYDIAVITLAEPVDARVSRYELFTGSESLPQIYSKTAYGHLYDPVNGTHDADYHFISFQNRYEAYGQDLVTYGYTYALAGMHLLYDYDNGLIAQDAIGQGAGFTNQLTDLGLSTEGFTAPGRSGSAGLLNNKVAGVTWGNVSISPYDIDPGAQATYGEVGIDVRVSAFASWISVTADFGLDHETTLPGFSTELEFSYPAGLAIESELSYPVGSVVASEAPSLALISILPGLAADIAITLPLQMDVYLTGVYGDAVIEATGTVSLESILQTLSSDIVVEPRQSFSTEALTPGFAGDISLIVANRFALQSLMGLLSQIQLKEADQFQWTATIPTLSSLINVETGFAYTHVFTGLNGELVAASNSISIGGVLPSLTMAMDLASRQFALESPLSGLKSSIAIGNQQYGIEGYLSSLRGGLTVTDAESFESESTFPGLMFDGLWRSFEISGELAGLRGSIRYDSAMCSTRYL